MSAFFNLVKKRRSIYGLGKNSKYSIEEIENRIREVMKHLPSAFNSQSTRVVVVFGEAHEKFWNHIYDVQKDVLTGDMKEWMSGVVNGAKKGLGTVLFFEDRNVVEDMPTNEARKEAYKQNNNAIAQYAIWLALAEMDLGANLQHFNIGYEQGFDKGTRELFILPDSYEMIAQMPFGSIEQEPRKKEFIDTDEQVKVFDK